MIDKHRRRELVLDCVVLAILFVMTLVGMWWAFSP
jgi:hypothetical protein